MALTLEQLQKTATLAYLDDEDAKALLCEANLILNQIESIHKVNVVGVEPLVHPVQAYQYLRDDVVLHDNCSQELAEAASMFIDNHYIVPKHLREQ